ncbi:HU family DNA-binding protein [Sulfobacillus thermosulfidooxidans]|uniref:HU family DNA-binding protein n=1 Tax=Sulfobacillus thermosulfidooxidans TaxID=28034 RepID=UPI003BFA1B20
MPEFSAAITVWDRIALRRRCLEAFGGLIAIHLIGFGTFTTKTLSARTVRLPDGRSLVLPARTRPVFRPSKRLCAMVDHRG